MSEAGASMYVVEGPEPFGGLECRDREHAEAVADELNRAYRRQPPAPEPREPAEPTPLAADLGAAIAQVQPGIQVSFDGAKITITGGGW